MRIKTLDVVCAAFFGATAYLWAIAPDFREGAYYVFAMGGGFMCFIGGACLFVKQACERL